MKILVIGDPHGSEKICKLEKELEKADLVLLTGDVGKADLARKFAFENFERVKKGLKKKKPTKREQKLIEKEIYGSTIHLLKYLSKFAPVYTIQGNVGMEYSKVNKMRNVHLVKNRVRNINGLRVGFLEYFVDTNWVQDFRPGDYMKSLKKAKRQTDKAKGILKRFGEVDILICHQPPYKVLDKVTNPDAPKSYIGKHAGSKAILDYIKRKQPKYVFCGHIHEGKGRRKIGRTEVYNVGCCGDYIMIDIQ